MQLEPLFFKLVFACCALGAVLSIIAGFLVVPEKKSIFAVLLWRKKEEFTPRGWQFRQASVACIYLALAVVATQWMRHQP